MKKFLEDYGFAILIAIVVILLIAMTAPTRNTIKSSVSGLVDGFGRKTVTKIDKTDKEVITTLKGSELTIESKSETDKYIAILRGYQDGREVSVASTGDKLICSDNMTNTETFNDARGAAETTNGIAKFIIENGTKLDENTKYYIEIMNIGTGEIFKSDLSTVDYDEMNTIGGENGGSGNTGNTLDMSNVDVVGVTGDFSSKGNLVTINNTQYRVLAVNGTRVKVMSMVGVGNSAFNSSSITALFGSKTGQKYADSNLDNAMISYYNSLPTAIQDAIVEQNINQSMYSWSGGTNASASFSAWHKNPFTDTDTSGTNYYLTRIADINVGTRKVYALDVDDAIAYLGSSSTPQDINEMFFNARNDVSNYVLLRSADVSYEKNTFGANGYFGALGTVGQFISNGEIRPAFIIDLSLLR